VGCHCVQIDAAQNLRYTEDVIRITIEGRAMSQEHKVVYNQLAREQAQQLDDADYLRLLDALGRFYNSEMTQHVGYLITSAVTYLALFALAIQAGSIDLLLGLLPSAIRSVMVDVIVSLLIFLIPSVIYFALPIPPFPLYMLSRVQYYGELSGAVWDHMGLTNSDPKYREELKNRMFQRVIESMSGGTIQAVMSLFEARLYLTCRPGNVHTDKWKQVFVISDELAKTLTPDTKRIVRVLKIGFLLRIAYGSQIRRYRNAFRRGKDKNNEDYRKGELFNECFDC
jgi:hypothetical protein